MANRRLRTYLFVLTILIAFIPSEGWSSIQIPMKKLKHGNFYTVQVELDQYGPATFIVDTGADTSVIGNWYVDLKGIPVRAAAEEGQDSGGHSFSIRETTIRTIKLGELSKAVGSVPAVPLPKQFADNQVAGILSPQAFFANQTFTLDFPKSEIRVGDDSRSTAGQSFALTETSSKGQYLVNAQIAGKTGRFYLDTGASKAAVRPEFGKDLDAASSKTAQRSGAAGTRGVLRMTGVLFELGSLRAKIDVDIEENNVSWLDADGKIGTEFLSQYAVRFDAKRKTLTLF